MRVFNETKTEELQNYDRNAGILVPDKFFVAHHDAVAAVEEQGHYETVAEYPNGGKDVEWVIDVAGVEPCEAYDEYEDILVFHPYTAEELEARELADLRGRRESECFPVINRGAPWYARLTDAQRAELEAWYQAWLDVTETKTIPERLAWLEDV